MRRLLLSARSKISPEQRQFAIRRVARQVINAQFLCKAQHIAFYMPVKSELSPLPLLNIALKLHKKCYLPVLHPLKHNRLYFAAYHPQDKLVANTFRIPEPDIKCRRCIPPWALDLVFVPLVGFDSACHRLGMGGGFYDRTFNFKKSPGKNRPLLVGLAYELQRCDEVPVQPWDVALDYVVTECKIYQRSFLSQ